jgi:hypothetical protein
VKRASWPGLSNHCGICGPDWGFPGDIFVERNPDHTAFSLAMLKQRTIIILMVAAVTISTALAQEPDRLEEEVNQIHSVIVELNNARKNSDAKAFSQLFVRDGTLRIGNEIVAAGRDEIERMVKKPTFWRSFGSCQPAWSWSMPLRLDMGRSS